MAISGGGKQTCQVLLSFNSNRWISLFTQTWIKISRKLWLLNYTSPNTLCHFYNTQNVICVLVFEKSWVNSGEQLYRQTLYRLWYKCGVRTASILSNWSTRENAQGGMSVPLRNPHLLLRLSAWDALVFAQEAFRVSVFCFVFFVV